MNALPQIHIDHLNVNLVGIRAAANDEPSKLEWSKTLCDGDSVTHEKAEAACKALGPGWRLPTRPELEATLDLGRHDPAVAPGTFPDLAKSAYYWTSTACAWSPFYAWIVSFSYGDASYFDRYDGACVRAVRSVSPSQ